MYHVRIQNILIHMYGGYWGRLHNGNAFIWFSGVYLIHCLLYCIFYSSKFATVGTASIAFYYVFHVGSQISS